MRNHMLVMGGLLQLSPRFLAVTSGAEDRGMSL